MLIQTYLKSHEDAWYDKKVFVPRTKKNIPLNGSRRESKLNIRKPRFFLELNVNTLKALPVMKNW